MLTSEVLTETLPAFLRPDHVGLVLEAERTHEPDGIRQVGVRRPHV